MSVTTLAREIRERFRSLLTLNEGIDATEYIRHLEREFDVRFTPDEVERLHTLGDMAALIARKLTDAGGSPGRAVWPAVRAVWPAVRRITADEMGVAESELHEGVRFVEDLCC